VDAHQQLAWDYPISAVVLGKEDDFVLIPLHDVNPVLRGYATAKATAMGFCYAGTMGYDPQCNKALAECEPGMEKTMACAVPKFADHVREQLTPPDVRELERLWNLPDSRMDKFCLDTDEPQATGRPQC
jgi:hypothetical protein